MNVRRWRDNRGLIDECCVPSASSSVNTPQKRRRRHTWFAANDSIPVDLEEIHHDLQMFMYINRHWSFFIRKVAVPWFRKNILREKDVGQGHCSRILMHHIHGRCHNHHMSGIRADMSHHLVNTGRKETQYFPNKTEIFQNFAPGTQRSGDLCRLFDGFCKEWVRLMLGVWALEMSECDIAVVALQVPSLTTEARFPLA